MKLFLFLSNNSLLISNFIILYGDNITTWKLFVCMSNYMHVSFRYTDIVVHSSLI